MMQEENDLVERRAASEMMLGFEFNEEEVKSYVAGAIIRTFEMPREVRDSYIFINQI